MNKVYIIYWSQSGNTESMAAAVADGVQSAGKEAVMLTPFEANIADLKDQAAFAMGCPAMGAEVLEECEMEPFVSEIETFVAGKHLGLFGSYGWGDGQWMRDWVDRMSDAGADILNGEGIIANEAPEAAELDACRELGKALAAL